MTPDEYCRAKTAAAGSSFSYAFLFLPPERRRAITALYAFCREVDDVVDECSDAALARAKLDWWRGEVERLFRGQPQHPVTRALAPLAATYGIRAEPLHEIVSGVALDLERVRYVDFAALERYCHQVAGVVGVLAAHIFGYRDPRTLEYAHTLGIAFQLTNILRDVGEDARRDRIYLPLEDLARHGVAPDEILEARHSDRFAALMRFEKARAEAHYERALAALPREDRRAQLPGLIMAAIYRTLLDEIERGGFRVLDRRTALTPLRKWWIATRTWLRA